MQFSLTCGLFRRCNVLIAALFALAMPSLSSAVNYTANVLTTGNSTVGHEATSNAMTPPSGFTQFAGGTSIFRVDPNTSFVLDFTDIGNDGLTDGDLVSILPVSIPILSINNGSQQVGTIDLSGDLVVGGDKASQFTHGLSGDLGFLVRFSEDVNRGQGYQAGDELAGTAFFQAASYSSKFNGIKEIVANSLEFALWGSTQGEGGINAYTVNGQPANQGGFGFDFHIRGQRAPSTVSAPIPEPAIAVTLGLGIGTLVWRRRRRVA